MKECNYIKSCYLTQKLFPFTDNSNIHRNSSGQAYIEINCNYLSS